MGERNLIDTVIDTVKHAGRPIILAGGLALTGAACTNDAVPVQEQLANTFEDTVDLCSEAAYTAYDTEFVDVENDPTTAVDETFEAANRKESEGPTFLQESLDECMADNFYSVIEGFEAPVIKPISTGVEESTESTVPVTTEGN